MTKTTQITLFALVLILLSPLGWHAQEAEPAQVDMAAMMAKARQYTQPGEHHQLLHRLLGTWDTETNITMPGSKAPTDKGVAEISWLIEGRWIQSKSTGTMMGMPMESLMVLGYDNFKQSYRMMTVGNFDTAMLVSEGDLDPGGDVLITYGTLDEYLTGEHDKMVKYVTRFINQDEMVLEIHDLPIGEKNTKVVEMRFKRRKAKQ